MFTHKGGETVKGGFYWNRGTWHLENVEGRTGTLPGEAETRYVWIPTLLMLVLAPIMGGLFVVFLPFVGFALLLGAAVKWAVRSFKAATEPAVSHARAHARKAL